MIQDLVDQGVIPQLVETLQRFSVGSWIEGASGNEKRSGSGSGNGSGGGKKRLPGDEVDVDIQCDMLHILATLCKDDIHR